MSATVHVGRSTETSAIPPVDEFFTSEDLAARWKVHVLSVFRWRREGKIPEPLKLTAGCTRWRRSDIEAFEREGILNPSTHRTGPKRGTEPSKSKKKAKRSKSVR